MFLCFCYVRKKVPTLALRRDPSEVTPAVQTSSSFDAKSIEQSHTILCSCVVNFNAVYVLPISLTFRLALWLNNRERRYMYSKEQFHCKCLPITFPIQKHAIGFGSIYNVLITLQVGANPIDPFRKTFPLCSSDNLHATKSDKV